MQLEKVSFPIHLVSLDLDLIEQTLIGICNSCGYCRDVSVTSQKFSEFFVYEMYVEQLKHGKNLRRHAGHAISLVIAEYFAHIFGEFVFDTIDSDVY